MNRTEMKTRLLELIRMNGSPCRMSCTQIAKVLGTKKHQVLSLVKELDADKQITYIPGHGNRRNIFCLGDIEMHNAHANNPAIVRKERMRYVFLSDNEYSDLLQKAGGEKWRELSICILSNYKRKYNMMYDDGDDYRRINAWVLNIVKKKAERKNKTNYEPRQVHDNNQQQDYNQRQDCH